MDEGKFVADFIASNLVKILALGKEALGTVDEIVQIKLKTAYTTYLTRTREKYSKSKSFFIRNQSVDLYSYYVPTGITCDSVTLNKPSFKNCLEHSNRIVITGTGGSGKTVLMKHLFLDCISDKRYTPVLIELRDLNSEQQTLDNFVSKTLETYGFDISGDYVKRAKKLGHFCFFLDGYDEVNHKQRKKLIKQIDTLSNKFSACPIFISSRPDDVFSGIDQFSIFNVMPLNLQTAINLIEKLPFDHMIKTKFIADLSDGLFEKHESFLSNPLLLSIMLLTYGENAEIPSKLSIFYNQAYEALFQRHDANKGGYSRNRLTNLDIQDFSRVFSLFSLQTYEKRLFKLPRTECLKYIEKSRDNLHKQFDADDYLQDLLSAACLLLEDGLEIAFSHRTFQEYFVALHISSAQPEIQKKLIDRYWKNMTSDNVMYLLSELNPELIESVLLVPKLEALFNEIGVKKKVGITHAAKYMKISFRTLNIEKDKLTASFSDNSPSIASVVGLAIYLCKTYELPDDDYFEKNNDEMFLKYGNEKGKVRFETSSLSYKSPVMADTLNSEGAFSISYLQAAFKAYKQLKLKHDNRSENLDELLGI